MMLEITFNKLQLTEQKVKILLTSIQLKTLSFNVGRINLIDLDEVQRLKLNFENIKIQNTVLVGVNFVRCNLNGSQFENVDISGINLNGALLFNCKHKNAKIEEMIKLEGHKYVVQSLSFFPDGTTLASGSRDYLDTYNIMVNPDFNFSKFKRVVYKKPFPFRRIIGVALDQFKNQPILALNLNLFQYTSCVQYLLIEFYFLVFSFLTILKHQQNKMKQKFQVA
ncbi:unnamed protein product [Paramecium pentaurelia]|uniref:Pentapeptide repeat-containing protein n=1 Tax=Paramecium pentaurelia TaxID=43138 RepID=A0A8S1VE06_9CILI|nr:unnamed protein product [Paramecium pentaurelia]